MKTYWKYLLIKLKKYACIHKNQIQEDEFKKECKKEGSKQSKNNQSKSWSDWKKIRKNERMKERKEKKINKKK